MMTIYEMQFSVRTLKGAIVYIIDSGIYAEGYEI